MRSIVIFRFFSHLPLLFVYQCITFLPLIFRFSLYTHRNRLEICRFSIFLEVDSQLRMEAVAHSQLAFVYHPGNPYLCAQIYNYAQINDGIIH